MAIRRKTLNQQLNEGELKKVNPLLRSTEVMPDKNYERKTYYLDEELIMALNLYAVYSHRDKSEIVREALRAYIPEAYRREARRVEPV